MSGLAHNIVLVAKLVTLYGTWDGWENALNIFDRMRKRNVYLWNAVIRDYSRKGLWQETLELYYEMQESGI